MPNEQTSVPLFTAGEVLTAADMNLSAGTGVPVFSNTTTRDAGFGGSGEKVLAEGQLCYLSDSNIVQYYTGAAWATVGPASSGSMVWVGGAAPSAAATVTIDNVFTSTYTNYLVTFSFTGGTTEELRLQFRYGTTTQASAYYSGFALADHTGAAGVLAVSNGTYIALCNDADRSSGHLFISGVGVSSQAICTGQGFGKNNAQSASGGGYVNSTQTYTGFIFTNSTGGSIFTGRVNVYGLANA
jgi:hypothetical protein